MFHKVLSLTLLDLTKQSNEQITQLFTDKMLAAKDNDQLKTQLQEAYDALKTAEQRLAYRKTYASKTPVVMSIKCSGNKMRLIFEGNLEGSDLDLFFSEVFKDKKNKVSGTGSYIVMPWGRAVKSDGNFKQLEWWFPEKSFTNDEVNAAISKVLAPLALPDGEAACELAAFSISKLGPRDYVTVVNKLSVLPDVMTVQVCNEFLEHTASFCARAGSDPDKVVSYAQPPITFAKQLGLGIFGATAAAASSKPPASNSSCDSYGYVIAPSAHSSAASQGSTRSSDSLGFVHVSSDHSSSVATRSTDSSASSGYVHVSAQNSNFSTIAVPGGPALSKRM